MARELGKCGSVYFILVWWVGGGGVGGRDGLTVRISGTILEAKHMGAKFPNQVAYNNQIRLGSLLEDSRNESTEGRATFVQDVIARSLRYRREVLNNSAFPVYDAAGLRKCKIFGQRGNVPAPNRTYTNGGPPPEEKTGAFPLLPLDWHVDLRPEYIIDAAPDLNQVGFSETKREFGAVGNERRRSDGMEGGGRYPHRGNEYPARYARMAESRGSAQSSRLSNGVGPDVAGQLHTHGAVPVFRGKSPVGPSVRV